mmetsp:Transcript_19662/g.23383  ORF Transcript_19662/g.23383 Transcript_19662/m.23383 type:complete len:612 (+) Transcript_19662:95-1930(+)
MSGLNPNAGSFSFNPSSASWSPATPIAAVPPPAPTEEEEIILAPTGNGGGGGVETDAPENGEGDEEEEIDENDPLWKVFLKIAKGDKAKAKEMLFEPDEYMHLPEVLAAIEGGDDGGDDWDADAPLQEIGDDGEAAEEPTVEVVKEEEKKVESKAAEEEEPREEEVEQESDPREHLNLVFIGHVDAGKSTLSGNILYLTDHVDKRTIEKYEREAKQRNRDSWFLAFIMDTSEEERAKGKTIEVGRAHFASDKRRFTIMDAPGHKSYVPNMIAGASQADVGVLVVSARKNEFEAGFEKGGQTKEHAMLAKTLGVKTLLVVINKMDDPTVKWDRKRYDEITSKMKPFLKSCGFVVRTEVKFLPISALTGANIKDQVSDQVCSWWSTMVKEGTNNTSDGTLLGLLDSLSVDGRDPAKPLRIPVLDRYYDRGTVILGKVENGTLSKGDKLMLMPTRTTAVVDSLYSDETPVKQVRPGDNVAIRVNLNVEDICKGFMICGPTQEAEATRSFVCFLYLADLTDTRPVFTAGYDCMLHIHTAESEVTVGRLLSIVDVKTKSDKKNPTFAKTGDQITCILEIPQSIVVAPFEQSPQLGRLTLRDEGKTIAIGKVLRLKA